MRPQVAIARGALASDRQPDTAFIYWLMALFAAFHVAVYLLLPDTAERFMLGDRAHDRVYKLGQLLGSEGRDDFFRILFHQGAPGDYIVFLPAYWLAGPDGVMLQNLLLYLVALWVFYWFCVNYFSQQTAAVAASAWCLLPATIFHPHAFVSEGVCDPLLIMAIAVMARIVTSQRPGLADLVAAGLLLTVLAFVRHINLLLPLAMAGVTLLAGAGSLARRARSSLVIVAFSLTLVGGWAVLAAVYEKTYPGGPSVGGLQSNLFLRGERMSAMGGFALPDSVELRRRQMGTETRTLLVPEYLELVAAHPGIYLKSVASDAFNLIANPGLAMVAGRFFGAFDLGERGIKDMNKWRELREREGFAALLREIWRTSPAALSFNLLGGLGWLVFLAVGLSGGLRFAFDWRQPAGLRLLLWLLPVYFVILSSMLAGYTRWDHRSPIEFVLALFFAIGAGAFGHWWQQRALRRASAA